MSLPLPLPLPLPALGEWLRTLGATLFTAESKLALAALALGFPLLLVLWSRLDRRWSQRPTLRALLGAYCVTAFAGVVVYKLTFWHWLLADPWFEAYTDLVLLFFVSRAALAYLAYRPLPECGYRPSVSVVMPVFDEEQAIERSVRSLLELDYPHELLELLVVDDGSRDGTAQVLERLRQTEPRLQVLRFPENRGKRAAQAAGFRATSGEILCFVDSDSLLQPDALAALVQPFADPRVGSVCGHADVANLDGGLIARMQAVRYFAAFRIFKAAESVFGMVSCVSGCFAGYRRAALTERIDAWEQQRFLGAPARVGEDRSLTNIVLRDNEVVYQASARCATIVPAGAAAFVRQQARWKRSWLREGWILSRFVWRKPLPGAAAAYVNLLIALVAPWTALRALVWLPLNGHGHAAVVMLLGLTVACVVYGFLFERSRPRGDFTWLANTAFVAWSLLVLLWLTYYSGATIRRSAWGTRASG